MRTFGVPVVVSVTNKAFTPSLPLLCVLMSAVVGKDMPSVDRRAEQHGLHRVVVSAITLPMIFQPMMPNISITLVEHIPSSMYIDLHQLQMEQLWGAPSVLSRHQFDVEKPESVSGSHSIWLFVEATRNAENSRYQAHVRLPVHLRYHSPRPGGQTAEVKLPPPKLLVKNEDLVNPQLSNVGNIEDFACDPSNSSQCHWRQLILPEEPISLKFEVPVGRKEDQIVVICGTTAVTIVASVIIGKYMQK